MSKGSVAFFALVKIVTGVFAIIQGRGTLKVTEPILKDYKVSQITGHIQLTKRNSKDVFNFLKLLKKLIFISIVGGFFTIIASKNFLKTEAHDFLDQYYSTMNETNQTNSLIETPMSEPI